VPDKKAVVNLRTVAEQVSLASSTVSAVLNNTPASWAIPQGTKDRVFRAAAELNYRPNFSARSLRTKRTNMVAVISSDFGRAPVARVVAGMERQLRQKGYLLILGAFDCTSEWNRMSVDLQQRGVEGVVAVGTSLPLDLELPVVSVDLAYVTVREPLSDGLATWLTELGESAVEAILRQIEKKDAPQRTNMVPKVPHEYAELPSSKMLGSDPSRFDLPAAIALQGEA